MGSWAGPQARYSLWGGHVTAAEGSGSQGPAQEGGGCPPKPQPDPAPPSHSGEGARWSEAPPPPPPGSLPPPPRPRAPSSRLQAGTAPRGARGSPGGEGRALTAGPVGVVPPVDADTLVGAERRVGLQAGALQARVGHGAGVEHAGLVVVLGGRQGVALGKQAAGRGAVRPASRSPPPAPARSAGSPPKGGSGGPKGRGTSDQAAGPHGKQGSESGPLCAGHPRPASPPRRGGRPPAPVLDELAERGGAVPVGAGAAPGGRGGGAPGGVAGVRTVRLGGVVDHPLVGGHLAVGDDLAAGQHAVVRRAVGAGACGGERPALTPPPRAGRAQASVPPAPHPGRRPRGPESLSPPAPSGGAGTGSRPPGSGRRPRGAHRTGPWCCCRTGGRAAGRRRRGRCRR